MPREGVTYEMVAAEADAMVAAGEKPGLRELQRRLGGSMSTSHQHLLKWRQAQPTAVPPETAVSPSVAREITLDKSRAIAEARAETEAALVAAQDEALLLRYGLEQAESERDELKQHLVDVTADRDGLAVRLAERDLEIARAKEEAERERRAAEEARIEAAQNRNKIEIQLEKLEESATLNKSLRDSVDAERTARVASEQAAAVLATRLETVQELLQQARSDNAQLVTEIKSERETRAREQERERQEALTERRRADELQRIAADMTTELAVLRVQQQKEKKEAARTSRSKVADIEGQHVIHESGEVAAGT